MANRLTLAVAGGRKTQSIVEHCALLPRERRALVVTYTQANQLEVRRRFAGRVGDHQAISVMGWYTFLLREFARPFLPFKFRGERVRGFNFDGRPYVKATGKHRFLDSKGAVYKSELGRLAHELVGASGGALVRRLEGMYDEILIDEVQDLSGYDWEILDALLGSRVEIRMVGDMRQAVLSTNPRGAKNKQYAYADAIKWFRQRESRGDLEIVENVETWRCHPAIARFSDTIFATSWKFPATMSRNDRETSHDGVFLVREQHVGAYIERFRPQCLRDSANSGKALQLDYLNFGLAKGATYERVLVVPTAGISKFVKGGDYLEARAAAKFYVAVTRAAQSVAIVLDSAGQSALPFWTP